MATEKREIELPFFAYIAVGLILGALIAISYHLADIANALKAAK
jgi:hypothetical protein